MENLTPKEFFNLTVNPSAKNIRESFALDDKTTHDLSTHSAEAYTGYDNIPEQVKYLIDNCSKDELILLITKGWISAIPTKEQLQSAGINTKDNSHPNT